MSLAYTLEQFREKVRLIRDAYPDETEEALRDTLEGESADLDTAIVRTMREAVARIAMAEGLQILIDRMIERRDRLSHSAQAMREASLSAMLEANIEKLPAPDMTLSIGYSPAAVVVVDEAAIPDRFWRVRREVNKAAVMVELRAGNGVPGCTESNRKPFLKVTRR